VTVTCHQTRPIGLMSERSRARLQQSFVNRTGNVLAHDLLPTNGADEPPDHAGTDLGNAARRHQEHVQMSASRSPLIFRIVRSNS